MENTKITKFCLLSFYKRGGGETPSEQGLCRESASDLWDSSSTEISKLMACLGFWSLHLDLEKANVLPHRNSSAEKGAQDGGRWTDALVGSFFSLEL